MPILLGAGTLSFGCGDCDDPYPVGTRLRVTVPEAFSGCHVTFEAGATYDLVAGSTTEDNHGCEYNVAQAPPVFTSTELVFGRCGGDVNPLGLDCRTQLPGCPEVTYSHIRIFYDGLPKEPGETVSSVLKLQVTTGSECRQGCNGNVDIPVTIRW